MAAAYSPLIYLTSPLTANLLGDFFNSLLGPGDEVFLSETGVSCLDVAQLQFKGVTVSADC